MVPIPQEGSIKIIKNTVGGDGTFKFTGTLVDAESDFGSIETSSNTGDVEKELEPGSYNITEDISQTPGFDFTSLTCMEEGGTNNTQTTFSDATATIGLDAGESVTCTYLNTRQTGKLTIKKITIGGDDKFKFRVTPDPTPLPDEFYLMNGDEEEFAPLPTDTYTIREIGIPDGWELKNASCDADFNEVDNGVRVEVGDGENVVCTFNDFKKNDDPMEEETKRFIYRRVDNLLTHGPDRARMLRRLQEQAPPRSNDGPLNFSGKPSGGSLSNGSGALVHNSDTMLADGGVPWMRDTFPSSSSMQEDAFGTATGPASTSSSLFSSIVSQLTPLAAGQTSFKFGTSLSEIRTKAAEAEARAEKKKLQEAGLSFTGQPYANPHVALRPGFDIWFEGHISRYNDDLGGINREGDFRILYAGADYVLAPGILIGALVQVDETDEDINGSDRTGEIDGTGWMVGPYFGAKLLNNLYFDARAAWGQSDNDIWLNDEDAGFRRGSFDTDRWLATATLTGVHYYGAWRLSPELGLAYGHESYGTYKNSLGQTVTGADANIGRFTGGAEVAYRMQTMNGTIIEPMVGIEGIWNFDSDDLVIGGVLQDSDDNRAKVEGGVMVRSPSGWGLRAVGTYDGIGSGDFDSYGGSLWVNVPLN